MGPREFLELVIRPNIETMATDVADVRLCYNAVASADALAAHIYFWCRVNAPHEVAGLKDDTEYRSHSGRNRAAVQMLHDVAKAAKHVELERGTPRIRTFADIQPRSFGYGAGVYGAGPYGGGSQVSVMVDGTKVQLSVLIGQTVEFYASEMDRIGVP